MHSTPKCPEFGVQLRLQCEAFYTHVPESFRRFSDAHLLRAMHSQLFLTSTSGFDCNFAAHALHCRTEVPRGSTSEFGCDFRIQSRVRCGK